MTSPVVLLLGTPEGRWRALAARLLPTLAAAPSPGGPGGLCASAEQALQQLASAPSPVRLVAFVEPPAHALAGQANAGMDRAPWVAAWQAEASRLLRLIQRHRDRCFVVDVQAAGSDLPALAQALTDWLEIPVAPPAGAPDERDDVALTLARQAVDDDPALRRVHAELHASCDWPETDAGPADPAAWRALGQWRRTLDGLGQLRAELGDAISSTTRLQLEREGLSEQLVLFEREISRLTDEQAQAAQRIASTQSELAAQVARAGKAAQATQAAKAIHDDLAARAAQAERTALAAQAELAAQLARQKEAIDLAAHRGLARERDLLVAQNHATQEALEKALLQSRSTAQDQSTAPPARPCSLNPTSIAELRATGARDDRPHREITWLLRQVTTPVRSVPNAEVRLVEHHGRPGLVVMGSASGEPLLRGWQETGHEDSRPYMLLIPSERTGAARMAGLDSLDWLTVLGVAERIAAEAAHAAPKMRAAWAPPAQRLLMQLQELPPVWRHAALRMSEEHLGGDTAWQLTLDHVHLGGRHLPTLTLLWQPAGKAAGLALGHAGHGLEPLTVWPETAHGDAADHLWLPLGGHAGEWEAWQALTPQDRVFALQAAIELPRLLMQLDAAGQPAPGGTWRAQAEALARDARRLLANDGLPPPSMARRLARRLLRRT